MSYIKSFRERVQVNIDNKGAFWDSVVFGIACIIAQLDELLALSGKPHEEEE